MNTPATERTVGFAEAKNQLSALTSQANATGMPFIVTKNNKPWVEVRPLATPKGAVTITPLRHAVAVPDLDDLFAGYDGDGFCAAEDGFASPVGREVL